jgi:hypothetical protein
MADFDLFLAVGDVEEDNGGTARGLVAGGFLEAEDVLVESDGFFEVVDAVAGVEEAFDHN